MKKIILSLILLTIALVSPVFATEAGDMEILGKVGYTLDTNVKLFYDGGDSGSTKKNFTVGTDFYFYVNSQVAMGFGVNNIFDSTAEYGAEDEYGFTNVYLSIRPKMDVDSDIIESFYFIAQAGYGFFRFDNDDSYYDLPAPSTNNGFYWGIGIGVEIVYDFFLEFMHSFNYGSVISEGSTYDVTYSAFSLNVGYKFRFKP